MREFFSSDGYLIAIVVAPLVLLAIDLAVRLIRRIRQSSSS